MNLRLITPPTLDIVPLAEMRAHLRVDGSEEDTTIASLTKGAVAHLDGPTGVLGWCLGAQTWRFAFDAFPDGPVRLPTGPLLEIVSIETLDDDGAYVTLAADQYRVDDNGNPAWIEPKTYWPSVDGSNAVRITFRAGHATVAEINPAVPVIVKLLVAHWYMNREAVGEAMAEVPMSASALIAAHRWHPV